MSSNIYLIEVSEKDNKMINTKKTREHSHTSDI